jgi:glycosyltransferase involved in cell wall biosynthesis
VSAQVDVILATFGRPRTVGASVESVLAQTESRLLLHVVCDGCDGETERRIRAKGDARVRFHRFPKARGFGYAVRNAVLRASDAPFVAYATDDDLWLPDHLERALARLEGQALDLVAFRAAAVYPPDTVDPHFFAFDWRLGPLSAFLRNWFMGAVTCVHRRALFGTVGYWDERLFRFGDRDFYNRARRNGRSAFVDEVTVVRFYAQHWQHLYAGLPEPPQTRYLPLVADPAWRDDLRRRAASSERDLETRRRQAADFTRFAARSGPRFLRYLWERRGRAAARARGRCA